MTSITMKNVTHSNSISQDQTFNFMFIELEYTNHINKLVQIFDYLEELDDNIDDQILKSLRSQW